ncbi:hypothetical protein B0H16DRAFT_1804932 [Mycena metata]|uniref:BHLH domain-containing protein n=1 Tax=Mycena metata TaxID=1033252 RepID=A0AAD7MGW2_9AGAR|nr:hypothetical protein B0H16DRAFT_1804932 [Mycena metata]
MHGSLPDFSHSPLCLFSPRLPLLLNRGIKLDPSDPLNLLLHNHSQHNMHQTDDNSSPSVGAPPDWNSLSSMWPLEDKRTTFPVHKHGPRHRNGHRTTDFGLFNPFQFTFEALSPLPSSESESGGSTSSFSLPNNPAAELANCVRKNAGVILAVQIGSEPQYHPPAFTAPPAPSYPAPNTAASAFTTAPVAPSDPPTPATPVQTATQSRPKTSHTTIARRYRTNVNARIQSLHQAVPALRVVDRAAAIKAGELYPGGDASDPENHINARGFVDGVKIVCKCSKAVVLKNREKRLTRELEGLKTLLRWLVGGTELLGEWEREWVGVFGGGERDEVGVEDGANANEDDAEDDEEGESDDEGGAGRKRKKAKVEPAPKVKVERKRSAEGRAPPCVRLRAQVYATCTLLARDWWEREGRSRAITSPPRTPPRGMCMPHARPARCARPHLPRLCPHPLSPMPSFPFPALVHNAALPSQVQLALGSDAAHAHTHVVCVCVKSPRSSPSPFSPPFPPFPAAHARAVESSADCTKLNSVVVQLRMHMPSLNKFDIFQIPV